MMIAINSLVRPRAEDGAALMFDRRSLLGLGILGMAGYALAAPPASRRLYKGTLFADYFQIYLRDVSNPILPDDYNDEVLRRRLSIGSHAIILHTARNMNVPVQVDWFDERPEPDLHTHQHVIEASFDCPSGQLIIAGLTDYEPDAARVTVPSGQIGVRVNIAGLDTLSKDGLDGEDRYLVQLWLGQPGLQLLAVWEEPTER